MRVWHFLRGHTVRGFSSAVSSSSPSRRTITPSILSRRPLSENVKRDDFASLKMHQAIVSALESVSIIKPTAIQRASSAPLLARRHTLIAAETGAGKTLAYLAPLLSHLKHLEKAQTANSGETSDSFHQPVNRPSILILVPTRELATQVLRVAKALSHVAKFRARAAIGGPDRSALRRSLKQSPVDILVGTPGAIAALRSEQLIFLSQISSVVIDEADILLATEGGFSGQVQPLISSLARQEAREKGRIQFVYSAATLPRQLHAALEARHDRPGQPRLVVARGDRLHKATPATELKTTFFRVAGGEEAKFAKAIEITKTILSQKGSADRLLIFCNERERRERLTDILRDQTGERIVHLCGANDRRERQTDWESFQSNSDSDDDRARVAVCSKSFGRGIDHLGIGTVLLIDVPWTGAEYLHRVGRVRGSGKAFVLVGNREQAVAEALFLGHVKGENLAAIQPKSAWKGYTTAGKDRIASETSVKLARRSKRAQWIDERPHAIGTVRGGQGTYGSRTLRYLQRDRSSGRRRFDGGTVREEQNSGTKKHHNYKKKDRGHTSGSGRDSRKHKGMLRTVPSQEPKRVVYEDW